MCGNVKGLDKREGNQGGWYPKPHLLKGIHTPGVPERGGSAPQYDGPDSNEWPQSTSSIVLRAHTLGQSSGAQSF